MIAQDEIPIALEVDGNVGIFAVWGEYDDGRKNAVPVWTEDIAIQNVPVHQRDRNVLLNQKVAITNNFG